ncbi:MAG: hypothetical protein IIA59_06190 [Candidatus Marinimicrobia bacterium]|nr:hypothetical protein [Candidatus Neomarinimicrobiota bacterium]
MSELVGDTNLSHWGSINTPIMLIDESIALRLLARARDISDQTGVLLFYSVKPLQLPQFQNLASGFVDGFAASSYFEAQLIRQTAGKETSVHFTSPGIRPEEIVRLADLCDYVNFNSLSQLQRFGRAVQGRARYGLRVNPQLSFLDDKRYNPSRRASKLGVPLTDLIAVLSNGAKDTLVGVSGLHFHNNTDSTDFSQLLQTVEHIDLHLGRWLSTLDWINLGGGYLFDEGVNLAPFQQAVELLKSKHELEIFIEPGAALVRDAGFIVSSVVDLFMSDGKQIAVLDTTVNHMPEVFEYQYEPEVLGHTDDGDHSYILAGASCLAGDLFGEYSFDEPLKIGSRVVFTGMGAYTLVKAHMFNGINLPTIYTLTKDGELVLEKEFTYEDFASRNGLEIHDHA